MLRRQAAIYGWLLLMPALVMLAAFTHIPALLTIWHSFFSTSRGKREAKFIGLENYRVLLDDDIFWQVLWKVYVPLAKPVYIAYGLVSVSYHWNNFLWPLIVTNSVETRPLTVGLSIFSSTDRGVDWSLITAATLMTSGPLLIAFLLFQRQFIQSFMRAGIK